MRHRTRIITHTLLALLILTTTGCDPTIQGILDSIVHTVQGSNDIVDISLPPLNSDDFDATFYAQAGQLQQGSIITLRKRATDEVADPINTPHMVSPVIEVELSPAQDFTAGLYLAVGSEFQESSGEGIAMYYWRPFGGTVELGDVPSDAEETDYTGIWDEVPGSFTTSARSIPNPVHETGTDDVNQHLKDNGEGGKSGKFVAADPGPQRSNPDEPWRQKLNEWGKSGWTTPPPAPQGYTYYGSTVVHNHVCVHVEGDLNRNFASTDLNVINSKTEVMDSALKDDIIVGHHYYKNP